MPPVTALGSSSSSSKRYAAPRIDPREALYASTVVIPAVNDDHLMQHIVDVTSHDGNTFITDASRAVHMIELH